jgi:hypothetical protein
MDQNPVLPSQPDTTSKNIGYYSFCALVGGAYGLTVRMAIQLNSNFFSVMSAGFIFLVPFVLGFISVYMAERKQPRRYYAWIVLPWTAVLIALAGTLITLLEGIICIAMFLPIALLISTLGGFTGGFTARSIRSRIAKKLTMACVLILPLTTNPWEGKVFYELESRRAENTIDIQASPDIVWQNIESVRAIQHDELPFSWAHAIGFPDPIEATLSHEGIGGVRHASFAGNMIFLETVDVWEPRQRLAFTISAENIPLTTLDEHVRIGGPYFDVVRGEYRLEQLGPNRIRLHLTSEQRLSTDFNWYAHLWTDAVMSDLQQRILYVIQQRCQAEERSQHQSAAIQ